jgi:hypothetical protein
MQNLDELKKFLSDAEQTAIEVLLKKGWKLMTEAYIESAKAAGFDYPTHTIAGRYPVCLTIGDIVNRESAAIVKPKKRGRPKKQ